MILYGVDGASDYVLLEAEEGNDIRIWNTECFSCLLHAGKAQYLFFFSAAQTSGRKKNGECGTEQGSNHPHDMVQCIPE